MSQALRFWREVEDEDLQIFGELYQNEAIGDFKLFEPFIMVIISHWPFWQQFESILKRLHSIKGVKPISYPIESFLTNLVYECPLPPRGRVSVILNCFDEVVHFKRPPPNRLPLRGSKSQLNYLFHTLSLQNILTVVIAMLCEKRVLLYSAQIHRLTPCIESLCTLIFPFFWQHIYVPVLPCK